MLHLLLTCEHGGNEIPPVYAPLFEGQDALLATHRGYDIGALDLFNDLKPLASAGFFALESRLLVELNRSENQADLFSAITRALPASEKNTILQEHYYPYRNKVEAAVKAHLAAGHRVVHLSVHSFTPELNGEVRQADIGLLYDPDRQLEYRFCNNWKNALAQVAPNLIVRDNYPYLGTADGFTTYLRQKHSAAQYSGIELEVNQKYPLGGPSDWAAIKMALRDSLQQALEKERQE